MENGIWKIIMAICEGVMMSVAARITAWVALISATTAWQLLGHTIGELALHVVGAMIVH